MVEYWTTLVIGLMMIISPWVLGFSDISLAKWCNILLGLALAIMSAWRLFGEAPVNAPPATEESQPPKRKRKTKNNVE
jgi:hypothetical protein